MVLELCDVRSFIDILTKAANDQEHNAWVKDGITTTKLEIKVLSISMMVLQTSVTGAHDYVCCCVYENVRVLYT